VIVIVGMCLVCKQNVDVLKDPDVVKQLGNILKTNVRACKALGHPYMLQVCVGLVFWFFLPSPRRLSSNQEFINFFIGDDCAKSTRPIFIKFQWKGGTWAREET